MKTLFKSIWVASAMLCLTFTANAQDEWDQATTTGTTINNTTDNMYRTGNVGIGTNNPLYRLHLSKPINVTGDAVSKIDFSSAASSIWTSGLHVESSPLGQKGTQSGIWARTSSNHASKLGEAIGALSISKAFSGDGAFIGVSGSGSATNLTNSNNLHSRLIGGNFDILNTTNVTLSGNNYWVAGMKASINGIINNTPNNGAVAAVIGIDNNQGTADSWAFYGEGESYFSEDVGIGTKTPDHRLEVRDNTSPNNILTKFSDTQDQQLFFVPRLGGAGYNWISQQDDMGFFWSDNTNQNSDAGFVIAPWKGGWHGTRFAPDGKVHIGGGTTDDKLQVGVGLTKLNIGSAGGQDLNWGTSYVGFNAGRTASGWKFENDGANNGGGLVYTNVAGTMYFVTEKSTGATDKFLSDADIWDNRKMSIYQEGKVAIGNVSTPGNYKLYVEDGILTEQVKIALHNSSSWADYVFQDDYDLKSLEEVEQHIQDKGHLHNTPSAEQIVAEGGIELKSITINQQEKIEELYLHLIELNKSYKMLEAKYETLLEVIEK